jgi:hypothetical protein
VLPARCLNLSICKWDSALDGSNSEHIMFAQQRNWRTMLNHAKSNNKMH